jgi:uncharacterized membrane protein YphA (DoxX/SURF4 family)
MKRILKEIAIWIPTILLVLMFLNAGIRKFPDSGGWAGMFRHVGYPVWFRYFIGVIEIASALLLVVPRTASYGAALVIVTMLGAIGTVLAQQGSSFGIAPPVVSLVLAVIVLVARWPRRARLYSFQRRMDSIM